MTHRYIRAMLRGATAAKVLDGWNGPHVPLGSYTVNPADGVADEWSLDRTRLYVAGLEGAGIEPLYRGSEPVHAYDRDEYG
jgi:hypothetical protein